MQPHRLADLAAPPPSLSLDWRIDAHHRYCRIGEEDEKSFFVATRSFDAFSPSNAAATATAVFSPHRRSSAASSHFCSDDGSPFCNSSSSSSYGSCATTIEQRWHLQTAAVSSRSSKLRETMRVARCAPLTACRLLARHRVHAVRTAAAAAVASERRRQRIWLVGGRRAGRSLAWSS